jgi:hypothetical protein
MWLLEFVRIEGLLSPDVLVVPPLPLALLRIELLDELGLVLLLLFASSGRFS